MSAKKIEDVQPPHGIDIPGTTAEAVRKDLEAAGILPWTNGGARIVRTALAVIREHLPVKPDRETVIAALAGLTREQWDRDPGADLMREALRARFGGQADAVLDLWPGRSEAEVKDEALREFAARVRDEMDDSDKVLGTKWATDEYRHGMRSALMQVDEEADRLAAEGGADRG